METQLRTEDLTQTASALCSACLMVGAQYEEHLSVGRDLLPHRREANSLENLAPYVALVGALE